MAANLSHVRAILYLVISIFLITFLRMVVGIMMRTMKEMMSAPGGPHHPPRTLRQRYPLEANSERDPVCGTFVPSTSLSKKPERPIVLFCSAECRDEFCRMRTVRQFTRALRIVWIIIGFVSGFSVDCPPRS